MLNSENLDRETDRKGENLINIRSGPDQIKIRSGSNIDQQKGRSILLKDLDQKRSVSLSSILDLFYNRIGQSKITESKRERGIKILKSLVSQGFSRDDIGFAVNWTAENAKEELYDISILEHTIGQALAAKKAAGTKQERENKTIQEQHRREGEYEKEQAERETFVKLKESLAADEKDALREQAISELLKDDYKQGFISEALIEIKENEILAKEAKEPERIKK